MSKRKILKARSAEINTITGIIAAVCAIVGVVIYVHSCIKNEDNRSEIEIIKKLVDKIPSNASEPIPSKELEETAQGLEEHLPKIENLKDLDAETLLKIGNVESRKSNYSKALMLYKEALSISRRTNDKVILGISLGNIGNIYHAKGELDKALEYHK